MTDYKVTDIKPRGKFAIFSVETREVKTPRGLVDYDVVVHQDAVNVLLIDNETNEVVITKEYRAGANEIRMATPAGLIEPNEAPIDTAVREVYEETGATLSDIDIVSQFVVSSSEGFTTEELHVFVLKATVHRSDERHFDPTEYVKSKWVSFDEVVNLIDKGIIKSAPTVSAVRTLQLKLLEAKHGI